MHWTLITLLVLCALCALSNIASIIFYRKKYMVGMLICLGWAIQQIHWTVTGTDSFFLFVFCDLSIIFWLLVLRFKYLDSFNPSERLIAASIPFTTALVTFAWLHGGHTTFSWWTNWWLVVGQMLIGLPAVTSHINKSTLFNRDYDPWKLFDLRIRHEG